MTGACSTSIVHCRTVELLLLLTFLVALTFLSSGSDRVVTTVIGFPVAPSTITSSISSRSTFTLQRSSLRLWSPSRQGEEGITFPIQKTDEEWKDLLTPEQYYVLRREGTETPGASPLNRIKAGTDRGTFRCAGCGSPLFVADTKYDSGTGWPSFFAPITSDAVALKTDYKLFLPRTECVCSQCGGHLGHVFEDGPEPTGQRYCMNGAAMTYTSDEESPELASEVQRRQQADPFRLSPQQIVPSIVVNGLITAFFVSSFLSGTTDQQQQQQMSPIAVLTIVPALYYGFLTTKNISKLFDGM